VSIPRPALWLYVAAWVLLLAAAACIGVAARGFLEDLTLLWAAVALGGAAIVTAVAAALVRRNA
jgi:hypothetical protein